MLKRDTGQGLIRLTAVIGVMLFPAWNIPVLSSDWKTSPPAEQGLDAQKLAKMNAHARADLPHLRSLLMARRGYLVFEEYYNGSSRDELQNIQSITKSVTGALVGIAIKQGQISLDQKVLAFFPEVQSTPDLRVRAITVKHLLTMSSGIAEGPPGWDQGDNPVESALIRPLVADPGAKYIYSSNALHILSAILARATHQSLLNFAQDNLLRPLGISEITWYKDKNGLELGCGSSLWKAADLLKFGQLYLNKGGWNGTQLVPEWFIVDSTKTHLTGDFFGNPISYGYLWFTDTISGHAVYFALGYGGQYLLVAPDLDVVVLLTSDWRQPEYPEHYALIKDFVIPSAIQHQAER